ncbi:MAG: hypothetical protein ACR2HG_09680 [Pyrinomonadaceae bacterium]
MRKHFIGLGLFSFIVVSAAVIYAVFSVPEINSVIVSRYETTSMPTSCWRMKRESSETKVRPLMVKQAVLDLKTKQLNWELTVPSPTSQITLHFFVKDKNKTRYINSISVPAGFENGIVNAASSYKWLDNLASYENLYVMPEYTSQDKLKNENAPPKFDADKATSVLLYSGE